jgi:hypothetical protein
MEIGLKEPLSSSYLALLASCSGTAFPDAVATVSPLLMQIEDPRLFLNSFKRKDNAERYPEASPDAC